MSVWTRQGRQLLTLTRAVLLLAQEKRETSDLILGPGRGQRCRQRRVVGAGRQLEGLPLELHQRLVTSSCTEKVSQFTDVSPLVSEHLSRGVNIRVFQRITDRRRWM